MDAQEVLDLWIPQNGLWESAEAFEAWIGERMYGGMDAVICAQYADMTRAAARGELDHWAQTARGRLALLIVLDQFPRSLWRDTLAAFAQDIKANLLVLKGIENGRFAELQPWEEVFCMIALGHCEGPDHLARVALIEELSEEQIIPAMPPQLAPLGKSCVRRTRGADQSSNALGGTRTAMSATAGSLRLRRRPTLPRATSPMCGATRSRAPDPGACPL